MFKSPFAILMAATFLGAVVTMLLGVAGLGGANPQLPAGHTSRATRLMALRVGLCALLLLEIVVYTLWLRPGQ